MSDYGHGEFEGESHSLRGLYIRGSGFYRPPTYKQPVTCRWMTPFFEGIYRVWLLMDGFKETYHKNLFAAIGAVVLPCGQDQGMLIGGGSRFSFGSKIPTGLLVDVNIGAAYR